MSLMGTARDLELSTMSNANQYQRSAMGRPKGHSGTEVRKSALAGW